MAGLLYVVASIAILAVAGAFVALVSGALKELRKVGRATDELSELINTINTEIVPIAKSTTATLEEVDHLIADVTQTVGLVNRVAGGAERLMETAHVASAATQAVKSSTAGIISVYEGVKQGIKTLRGS